MHKLTSLYSPRFPIVIAYMLQATEYDGAAYLKWLYRTNDFSSVMKRRSLDRTSVARAFVTFVGAGTVLQLAVSLVILWFAYKANDPVLTILSIGLSLTAPIAWAHLVVMPMLVAKWLYINPKAEKQRTETKSILAEHKAVKIAVAGSYGKTTMKELLTTVLAEGMTVAATPGNKNVAASHHQFATSLTGNEQALVIEFGEGKPGDVERFTDTIQPDIAVITGLAPAHLDHYATVRQAGEDIFSLARALKPQNVYVNSESSDAVMFMQDDYIAFDQNGLAGWKIKNIKLSIEGTQFTMSKDGKTIAVTTGLLGKHLVGVTAATAAIASELGLSNKQIESGLKKVTPYEHRMQPYQLGGAWIIDDAYNGNLEGIRAGTALLAGLDAKRKIYVTPGLVDQGSRSDEIHVEVGRLIATARPDIVVLMKNSASDSIAKGLNDGGYEGIVLVQEEPLAFYQNLDQFCAAGDIVMLQNDWTDNYQ